MKPTFRHYGILLFLTIGFVTKQNLSAQTGNPVVNGDYTIHYPKLSNKDQDFEKIKSNLTTVLKRANWIYDFKSKTELPSKEIKEIFADNEGIKIIAKSKKNNQIYNYKNIIDSTMVFYSYKNTWHYVNFPSLANIGFSNFYDAQQLADYIYHIQYPLIDKRRDSLLLIFKPIAKTYKTSGINEVSQEQKALFKQADQFVKQNDFVEAIKVYNKAININQLTYPEIYLNVALLYAQINFFDYAIYYMQKYLLLEPKATEARNALDKIYEWEAIIGK